VENFDFSRVSFAQPVAEGGDFEDAFYPDVTAEDDRLMLAISHAPRKLRNGSLTAAVNAMWCAEQGYPFVLDQRNVHPAESKSQVIPHWLRRCKQEGINWLLWLDGDLILVGQNASLDFIAKVIEQFDGSDAQILLPDKQHGTAASATSFGMIFLRCSDWAIALMEKVRNESSDEGIHDDEAFWEMLVSDALEAKRRFVEVPPEATHPVSLLASAERQPVLHLAHLPASIRNETFSAALAAECSRTRGSALNLTSVRHAYENSLYLAANKDFREAGTSRYAFVLAKRFKEQGRMQEAEDLLRWALDGLHAELGEQKIDTLFGKVALAKFLADQDRVSEARPIFEDAVAAGFKALGAHNPVMLDWQERLALLLGRQGIHQEATGLLRQVIRGRRRWREEARVKAAALQMRELLLQSSNAVPSAEQLIEETMSNFPDAADNVARQRLIKANEKSSKLSGEGNLNQAEWVLKRALEKSTLALPVSDPDLLVSRLNLGALRQRMSKPEALLDLEEVFQAQVSMMGPDHPDTQATIQAISGLEGWQGGQYNVHGRYQGALSKLTSAINRFAKRTKAMQGRSNEAVQNFEAAIRRGERKLGKQNHGVLKAKFNLAVSLATQDRSAEAFALWRGVLQNQLRHLGPFNSDTLATQRHILSWVYQDD
ncbi:unnamed protein product, partial [Symbiodinium pilosum]